VNFYKERVLVELFLLSLSLGIELFGFCVPDTENKFVVGSDGVRRSSRFHLFSFLVKKV